MHVSHTCSSQAMQAHCQKKSHRSAHVHGCCRAHAAAWPWQHCSAKAGCPCWRKLPPQSPDPSHRRWSLWVCKPAQSQASCRHPRVWERAGMQADRQLGALQVGLITSLLAHDGLATSKL